MEISTGSFNKTEYMRCTFSWPCRFSEMYPSQYDCWVWEICWLSNFYSRNLKSRVHYQSEFSMWIAFSTYKQAYPAVCQITYVMSETLSSNFNLCTKSVTLCRYWIGTYLTYWWWTTSDSTTLNSTIMEKIIETLCAIPLTTMIPVFKTDTEPGAWHGSIESKGLSPSHQYCIGNWGGWFSPQLDKVPTFIFNMYKQSVSW